MSLPTLQQKFGDRETTNVVGLGNEGMDEVSTSHRAGPTDVTTSDKGLLQYRVLAAERERMRTHAHMYICISIYKQADSSMNASVAQFVMGDDSLEVG